MLANIGGNTGLSGAMIASTADLSKNRKLLRQGGTPKVEPLASCWRYSAGRCVPWWIGKARGEVGIRVDETTGLHRTVSSAGKGSVPHGEAEF